MLRPILFFLSFVIVCAAENPKIRPASWAQPVISSSLENFYRVSDDLYRSEQPKPSDIADLKQLGIRSIVSLRQYHQDSIEFAHAGITSIQYQMDAGSVSETNLVEVLRAIRKAQKPVLVHCWHGSDRTGFIVAGYRMVFMDWTADQAIEELRLGGFGYHGAFYPNITESLKKMDIKAVKKAVFEENTPPKP